MEIIFEYMTLAACLKKLPQLSHLSLMGNPVTLLEDYRSHVVCLLLQLVFSSVIENYDMRILL